MSDVPSFRELCLRCRRPKVVCWCAALTPIDSRTHVVFIQHPREAKVPISTCRMAHLSLPNSELHVGLGAVGVPQLEALCAQPGTAVLFPSDSAVDVADVTTPPRTLIVVDGTWSNAKKVVEKCPLLSKLPRLAFTPDKPGNYRIRKEPEAHCLATIEATAYVLERLEAAPGRYVPMLGVFEAMVDRQLEYIRSTGNQSRHRRRVLRQTPRVDPLQVLRESAERLVVVFGEANAWPLDHPERPTGAAELVQLSARHLASGASFESLLRPTQPVSPSVECHLDVSTATVSTAPARGEVMAAWRRFLPVDAVLVGWGHFCRDLLAAEGFEAPFLDVRALLAQANSRRPGPVECFAEQLKVELPNGQGRAARRITALTAVTQAIVADTLVLPPSKRGRRRESPAVAGAPTGG